MALSAQDLKNGLAAIAELTIKAKDAPAVVALMDRYRAEIAALEAPPKAPEQPAAPVAKTDLVPTNGAGHSTPDA